MKFITIISLRNLLIKREKLFILLIVFSFGVLFFFLLGQMYYDARKDMFDDKAESAFRNALQDKLQENSFEGYVFASKRKTQSKDLPDTIYINDAEGKHTYPLDKEKNSRNITDNPSLRFWHSNYLSVYPIVIDSLYERWRIYLMKERLSGNYMLQIIFSDKKNNVTTLVFPRVPFDRSLVPCFKLTVGYRCEIDIYGFSSFSWSKLVGLRGIVYSLFYWLCIIGICRIIFYLKSRKKRILTLKKERENKLVEQKQFSDNVECITLHIHSYQLTENILFYPKLKILVVDDEEISMYPQIAILLQHFLDAPEYVLRNEEIEKIFWTEKSYNMDRIYNLINRLRQVLRKTFSIRLDRYELSGYQLTILSES